MAKPVFHAVKQGPRKQRADADELAGVPQVPVTEVNRSVKVAEVPDGSAAVVEDWVSGDRVRAQAAIDREKKSSSPRASLISTLERLTKVETGAGIGSGEA